MPGRDAATVRELLAQAPPGELRNVASDVRALLGDEQGPLGEVAAEAFKAHNEEQMVALEVPGSAHKALVCASGAQPGGGCEYLDAAHGRVVTVDHVKQSVSDSRAVAGDEAGGGEGPVAGARAAAQAALSAYVARAYASKDAACGVFSSVGGDGALELRLAAHRASATNFWSGRWRARYRAEQTGDGALRLTGAVKVCVHYYEEGNVQLNTEFGVEPAKVVKYGEGAEALASALVGAIEAVEQEYHASLQEAFKEFSANTFKDLRRKLPVTMAKFDWQRAQHKVAVELATKEKEAVAGK